MPRATLAGVANDTYNVVRFVAVDAAPDRVFGYLVDFHHWASWSPWEGIDPHLRRTYSGADAGVGAVYAWSGNRKAGQGRMEITDVTEPSLVRIDLQFEKPFKARNKIWLSVEQAGSGSLVTWSLTGKRTLLTKVMGIVKSMDALVGPDFERGLAQLKFTAESPGTR